MIDQPSRDGTTDRRLRWAAAAAALAALLCAGPGPQAAGAQDVGDEAAERVEQRYGAEVVGQVRRIAEEARSRGIPAGPVWDKALEGAAKSVPEALLVKGIRAYRDRLAEASRMLPPAVGTDVLVAAADARERGVPGRAVREVARAAAEGSPDPGSGRSAIPLVVLGDLVSAGVPVERARGVVRAALERGQGARGMLVTSWAVRDLIRRGRGPAEAARRVERAVGRGRPPTSVPGVGAPPANLPRPGGPPVPPGAGPPGGKGPPDDRGGSGG